jgi:hypothetical protein
MQLVNIEYVRADVVSYWVDITLGQGEFPRYPSLSHLTWVTCLGSRLNGNRAHEIQEVVVSIHECLCRGCVVTSSTMHFLQSPLFFFHSFINSRKG